MQDIPRSVGTMDSFGRGTGNGFYLLPEFVEGGSGSAGDVEDFMSAETVGEQGIDIGLDHIAHIGIITGDAAVPINYWAGAS